jgi:hypothetical protein
MEVGQGPNVGCSAKGNIMKDENCVAYSTPGRIQYRSLMGKEEGERPLERPRRRWEIMFKC